MDDTKKIKDRKPLVFQHFWTILGTILCIFLIPILVINCTLIAKSYLNNEKIPDIGGRFPMIVLTDSMYPSIQSGDLIICHTEDPANVKAHILKTDGSYEKVDKRGKVLVNSQDQFCEEAIQMAKECQDAKDPVAARIFQPIESSNE